MDFPLAFWTHVKPLACATSCSKAFLHRDFHLMAPAIFQYTNQVFPTHFSMLFSILWTAIPSAIPFQARLFPVHSKICLHLPKPVNRIPWREGDICLAWLPRRSPQDTRLPSGGRRVWDSQQRTALCQPIRVTEVRQRRQTSVNVKIRLCWHLLGAAIFGRWTVSEGWAGLVSCVCSRPVPRLFALAPAWLRGGIRRGKQRLYVSNAAQTGAPFTTAN